MTNYELIREAILKKQNIKAFYQDHERIMSPHTLGTKNGLEKCLFYQFGGSSSSGLKPVGSPANWRCVFVSELTNVEVIEGDWKSASNHSRKQTCVDEVDVEISF